MEKELLNSDKKLLLKDLCARLPYGVKYSCDDIKNVWRLKTIFTRSDNSIFCDGCNALELCKPYLFPISSMTEEQKSFFEDKHIEADEYLGIIGLFSQIDIKEWDEVFHWLNKNHFDYRGLIEKELAIDATGLNIY